MNPTQVWRFIKANFGDNPRLEFLDLLGYNPDEVSKKIEDGCGVKVRPPTPEQPPDGGGDAVNDVANRLNNLDTTADKEGAFDAIASQHQGRRDLRCQPVDDHILQQAVSVVKLDKCHYKAVRLQ